MFLNTLMISGTAMIVSSDVSLTRMIWSLPIAGRALRQAWGRFTRRIALPAIGNDQIILVKDTSLLTVIAIREIMSVFRNINSNQLDPWTPLVWVCLFYLAVTMTMSLVISLLERRADWSSEDEDGDRSRLRRLLGSIGKGLGRRRW